MDKTKLPWIEKYRTVSLKELFVNETLDNEIKTFIKNKQIPNLIVTGPPGVGKTSASRIIAHRIFEKYSKKLILELNASDERGMKSMQEEIITFTKSIFTYSAEDKEKYPKFKIVILDEADNLVQRYQPLLNEIMEKFKTRLRIIFICNSSNNIIDSIQSRCMILRFQRVENNFIFNKLKFIIENEDIECEDEALKILSEISYGDMRYAINSLEMIYIKHKNVKIKYVDEIYDKQILLFIKKLFDNIIESDLKKSISLLDEIIKNGYSESDIVYGMTDFLRSYLCELPKNIVMKLFEHASQTTLIISNGHDSYLQLLYCIISMYSSIKLL